MHIWWTNLINYFDKSGFTSNMYCVVTFEHEVLISQNLSYCGSLVCHHKKHQILKVDTKN